METTMFTEQEENGKTEDGFYQHKETGAVVELVNDPTLGAPLTNAYLRAGFVYAGKVDPRIAANAAKAEAEKLEAEKKAEIERIEKERKEAEAKSEAEKKALEDENTRLKAELAKGKVVSTK
jgi:hypothetical protein